MFDRHVKLPAVFIPSPMRAANTFDSKFLTHNASHRQFKAILTTAKKIRNSARLVLRFAGTGSCSSVVLQVATGRVRAHWPRVLRCYCMAEIGALLDFALDYVSTIS